MSRIPEGEHTSGRWYRASASSYPSSLGGAIDYRIRLGLLNEPCQWITASDNLSVRSWRGDMVPTWVLHLWTGVQRDDYCDEDWQSRKGTWGLEFRKSLLTTAYNVPRLQISPSSILAGTWNPVTLEPPKWANQNVNLAGRRVPN